MDIKNIYHIAQRAMGAQLVRLNATASNLANADNIASNPNDAYKPVKPVFETKYSAPSTNKLRPVIRIRKFINIFYKLAFLTYLQYSQFGLGSGISSEFKTL